MSWRLILCAKWSRVSKKWVNNGKEAEGTAKRMVLRLNPRVPLVVRVWLMRVSRSVSRMEKLVVSLPIRALVMS